MDYIISKGANYKQTKLRISRNVDLPGFSEVRHSSNQIISPHLVKTIKGQKKAQKRQNISLGDIVPVRIRPPSREEYMTIQNS
jgi:hypothetical protein